MPQNNEIASQISIKLKGNELDHALTEKMVSVSVDQHVYLPGAFTIKFHDPGLEIMDQGSFNLTDEVEILAENSSGEQVSLIKGEVVSLEPVFGEGMMSDLIISGFDKLHRLYREPQSRAFLNVKDSDLAEQIARNASLDPQVESTSTVYDHIYQNNISNLRFLQERARRIGFECFVDDGKLYFRKPQSPQADLTLTWGQDLLTCSPRISLAEQVDEVIVHGWDVQKKEVIVGRASQASLHPQVSERSGTDWSSTFGSGKKIIVDQPVASQGEADQLAAARLEETSGAFIVAEGTAFRKPEIKAGRWMRLEGLGERLSGSYLVTRVIHSHTKQGLKSEFFVTGTRKGTLMDTLLPEVSLAQKVGAIPAIVTNNDDPSKQGRVKVKFPTISEDVESAWARIVSPGAGPESGFVMIPEVGDEVLVLFENGSIGMPYVLGGVWNGKHDLPPEVKNTSENHKVKTWHSPHGHSIAIYDDNTKRIELLSADGRKITLDDQNRKIVLETSNASITLEDQKITMQSGVEIEIKATNIKLKGDGRIEIEAGGDVKISGAIIQLN